MYSKVVLNLFNNPKNAGRIKKPDGIADCFNFNETAHVEFSLRIESGIIQQAQFRAQANPYIIAICSTITQMLKGKMVSMLFLDPYSIKKELGDETDIDITFCIDCVKMAIDDYKERLAKENKSNKNNISDDVQTEEVDDDELDLDNLNVEPISYEHNEIEQLVEPSEEAAQNEDIQDNKDDDDDFADFFDFLDDV